MPKSTSVCNSILALIYNATPWANVADNAASSPLTAIAMALATASYSGASTLATNETVYTNYLRKEDVARSTSGWTAPAAGATSNVAAIEFAQCGASGATITSAATGKTGGGAAIPFHYGDLNSPIAVSNQIQPRFAIGAVTITET
jgi:hypothetical protein